MHKYYPACLYANPGCETLTVLFPDLPGCLSQGDNMEHALDMAADALELYLEDDLREGKPLPTATPLHKVQPEDLHPECPLVAIQMVPVALPANWKRYTATMDANLLNRIDRQASTLGMNRSGFLAEAARRYLQENRV
jgi:predicted RNase H-like HicB family nuclease